MDEIIEHNCKAHQAIQEEEGKKIDQQILSNRQEMHFHQNQLNLLKDQLESLKNSRSTEAEIDSKNAEIDSTKVKINKMSFRHSTLMEI